MVRIIAIQAQIWKGHPNMEEINNVIFIRCNCVDCGGEHERGQRCPEFANSYDGKCRKCNDRLEATATAVDRTSQDIAITEVVRQSQDATANAAAQPFQDAGDWMAK